ncbi:GIY-YIG nuclease family protein [Deinococcus sp. RIT780]|uniref:GIY-YIG nuclease family protein n=1 Tax=Deinococcus sp. RIT780 TaxID=2870472 RepID=UPI001C8A51D6|nr:GIY-YIG nuclease family protein [Deinococcus sp. RIT780]MBX8466586.1 GIY-YIG nuclease family protein [Deinococcus sp. RIT780]
MSPAPDSTLEVTDLEMKIREFVNQPISPGSAVKVGQCRTGVYAFFDYDNEPIYVGQTTEKISTRIRRHLTGQRSDAVAKSVLDVSEVRYVSVWILTDGTPGYRAPKADVDALEWLVHQSLIAASRFGVILNEADPPGNERAATLIVPDPIRGELITPRVLELRGHIDTRMARRAQTISNLARVISERSISTTGIRRVLLAQAKRLTHMAEERYTERGGDAAVAAEAQDNPQANAPQD